MDNNTDNTSIAQDNTFSEIKRRLKSNNEELIIIALQEMLQNFDGDDVRRLLKSAFRSHDYADYNNEHQITSELIEYKKEVDKESILDISKENNTNIVKFIAILFSVIDRESNQNKEKVINSIAYFYEGRDEDNIKYIIDDNKTLLERAKILNIPTKDQYQSIEISSSNPEDSKKRKADSPASRDHEEKSPSNTPEILKCRGISHGKERYHLNSK